jgi:hypothetical protein
VLVKPAHESLQQVELRHYDRISDSTVTNDKIGIMLIAMWVCCGYCVLLEARSVLSL